MPTRSKGPVCVVARASCERYDRSQSVISNVFRLSFAFIRRTNYSSCHGCSFVDGVFIPMRKSPITSRENCLSLQPSEVRGGGSPPRQCTSASASSTVYTSFPVANRDVSITPRKSMRRQHPIRLMALVINCKLKDLFIPEDVGFFCSFITEIHEPGYIMNIIEDFGINANHEIIKVAFNYLSG